MNEYVTKINNVLQNNDIVIVFDDECLDIKQLHNWFLESTILKNSTKKIKILELTGNEKEMFLELYRLYEFSGHIHYVADAGQYGTLLNYLKTGIINEEEFFSALLN